MDRESSVVAIFDSYEDVNVAAKELQRTGPSFRLSLVGKHCKGDEVGRGFFMHEVFNVPGYGTMIVGGPLGLYVSSALRGIFTEQGLSMVGSAIFYYAGIPKERIVGYEAHLKKDKFLLMALGVQENAESVRRIFRDFKALEVDVHRSGVTN